MDNQIREWKNIANYEGLYEVSNHGEIRSIKSGRNKVQYLGRDGYYTLSLHKGGKSRTQYAHRITALAFAENPNGHLFVGHDDNVKTNNKSSNLKWVTTGQNTRKAFEDGLCDNHGKHESRLIFQISVDGQILKVLDTAADMKHSGFDRRRIIDCCNGKRKSYKRFVWKYSDHYALHIN